MVLQLIFGMTMSPTSKYLQFSRRIIVKILKKHHLFKLCLPSNGKLEEYRRTIETRHPALNDVCRTMDGMKCCIEEAANEIVQS